MRDLLTWATRTAKASCARRTLTGLLAALLLTIVAAAAGGVAWRHAKVAQENFGKGQITESHFRAEQAKLAGEDHVLAMLLALEGLPDKVGGIDRPFVNEPWYKLYDAHLKQRERAVLAGHTGPVNSAVFSVDGTRILTTSSDQTARLWDADGRPLATLEGHKYAVWSAVFSADGTLILTASYDQTARLWDAEGKPLATLAGHKYAVWSAEFSADGKRILTASDDNTARLWDADGKPLATLEGHKDSVTSAVFSADGAIVITASSGKTARLWHAYPDPQELVNVVKKGVPRYLAPKERESLFLPLEPSAWCKTMGKWPYDAATLAAAQAEARK
jgi:hypothetical protein